MRFKIGQQVVCKYTDESWRVISMGSFPDNKHPKDGEIVTVMAYVPPLDGDEYILLEEYGMRNVYFEGDFDPIANISEVIEILNSEPHYYETTK